MTGFGELLRATRIEKGLEVGDIAQLLSLRKSVIERIESECLGELPERPLTLGYIERYARVLGLDWPTLRGLYPPKTPTVEIGARRPRQLLSGGQPLPAVQPLRRTGIVVWLQGFVRVICSLKPLALVWQRRPH
jgi:transcriptional regulator with XRE-family HTH domain